MKFKLICSSNEDYKMIDYIYKIRMQDIHTSSEKVINPIDESTYIKYTIDVNSLEDLLRIKKTLEHELILRTDDDEDCIEIYDYWRE